MPSIEQAMLARAYPHVLAAKARAIVDREEVKGCQGDLVLQPVRLEPVYQPIVGVQAPGFDHCPVPWEPEAPVDENELTRLWIWISPEQKCDWNRSELFLKNLSCVHHRLALEILGNQKRIVMQILCYKEDLPVVRAAFLGQFEKCYLSEMGENDLIRSIPAASWADALFWDFYPLPPYSHLLTRPEELKRSPYTTLLASLADIPPPAIGLYQVVFAPVSPQHNWHENVQALLDLEYRIKLISGLTGMERYAQQVPSGDLRQMATDVKIRSHNDKPFFAAALRIGIIDGREQADSLLRSLAVIASVIQHGGRPLNRITAECYHSQLSPEAIGEMFAAGLTYRSGFLVNSEELASLVHIPPPKAVEHLKAILPPLETLPSTKELATGAPIGVCSYAGTKQPVCIPDVYDEKHTHAIGGTGTGKSTLLEHKILYDIRRNQGVAVLDPHGRLVQRLLYLIPEEFVERVIYIDPGDPDWIPIWNPFSCGAVMNRSRIADDMVGAFKSFITGWGDRLEHLLKYAFLAVLHLPNGSLLDASDLLRQKAEESREIRDQLRELIDNEVSRQFWREDFDRYRQPDLTSPQHKLSKLLTSDTVGPMLSQGDSSFNFRDVMDSGKILLVDLSRVGSEVREILGCFVLSLLHLTALGRGSGPDDLHKPFHIYCDEAHRFLTDAMEDLIAETRKYGVSLTLAHQYMSQFNTRKTDALSGVGSTIIFKVDRKDAQHLKKDLQGKVDLDDLSTLEVGQAIARIGNDIVRVRTRRPLDIPEHHCRDRIITRSRELYYKPIDEVRCAIRNRRNRWEATSSGFTATGLGCGPLAATGTGNDNSRRRTKPFDPEAFDYDTY